MKKMIVKFCLLGEGAVGKTSLILRFVKDVYGEKYITTIGTNVTKKVVELQDKNIEMTMMIWDIMGQAGFRQILKNSYFYGAQAGIVVCDLTRRNTFKELEGWIDALHSVAENAHIVIIGNKCDLKDEIEITEKELSDFASKYDAYCCITSAKTGENVEKAFNYLGNKIADSSEN